MHKVWSFWFLILFEIGSRHGTMASVDVRSIRRLYSLRIRGMGLPLVSLPWGSRRTNGIWWKACQVGEVWIWGRLLSSDSSLGLRSYRARDLSYNWSYHMQLMQHSNHSFLYLWNTLNHSKGSFPLSVLMWMHGGTKEEHCEGIFGCYSTKIMLIFPFQPNIG